MVDPWKDSRRREALRPIGSALGEESGARSNAALRVWDGPSGFLWREDRKKPDSDSDYGQRRARFQASSRLCSRLYGVDEADNADRRFRRRKQRVATTRDVALLERPRSSNVFLFFVAGGVAYGGDPNGPG